MTVEVSDGVRNLAAQLVRVGYAAQDDFADLLTQDVQAEIRSDGSVRTGFYVNTVRPRQAISTGDVRTVPIESDAPYSLFPEQGRRPNRSGRGGFQGKFSQLHAIQKNAGRRVNDAFSRRLREIGIT